MQYDIRVVCVCVLSLSSEWNNAAIQIFHSPAALSINSSAEFQFQISAFHDTVCKMIVTATLTTGAHSRSRIWEGDGMRPQTRRRWTRWRRRRAVTTPGRRRRSTPRLRRFVRVVGHLSFYLQFGFANSSSSWLILASSISSGLLTVAIVFFARLAVARHSLILITKWLFC